MSMHRKTFTLALDAIKQERHFNNFSDFITQKLSLEAEAELTEETRKNAYQIFRTKTGGIDFASPPTMRKWFGIGGEAMPDREQIYMICLSMGASVSDLQEYLLNGIHEQAFEVNDYREVILVYGLENHKGYEKCVEMIHDFELKLSHTIQLQHTCGTQTLYGEFIGRRYLPWKKFCEWMLENAAYFKGYSKTTLQYFQKYKKIILQYAKKDAQEELERFLSETDYSIWCRKRLLKPSDYSVNARKYARAQEKAQNGSISRDLSKSIRELCTLAYTEKESNARLLSEVFQSKKELREGTINFRTVSNMTEKHISDMLNVPVHKEHFFLLRQAEIELCGLQEDAECPEWIVQLHQDFEKNHMKLRSAGDARKWVDKYRHENKRRCLQIQRDDLLPLILYVAQHRYLDSINQDMSAYCREDALEVFQMLADSTLAACNMCRLNQKFELDAVLCACYQQEEMFSYAELLEISGC